MKTIQVQATRPYEVKIAPGLLRDAGRQIAAVTSAHRCLVVSDETVAGLYGSRTMDSLWRAGFDPMLCTFPAGEQNKTIQTWSGILSFMAEHRMTRSDFVVALGGGVTGDMAGFAAACYQRGIGYIQMPTTLLAASDSSVGGKCAVDMPQGKNLCGAFWQPSLVLCDTDTFATLKPENLADGMAETLKHALIADSRFFEALTTPGGVDMESIVGRNVEIKAAVVAKDERESGLRKQLNFGHTLGHAVEQCSRFSIPHGHAVAIGMVLAARGAERLGWGPGGLADTIAAANRMHDLPVECPFTAEELYQAATADKKRAGDSIDLVLLEKVGKARLQRTDMAGLKTFAEAAVGK